MTSTDTITTMVAHVGVTTPDTITVTKIRRTGMITEAHLTSRLVTTITTTVGALAADMATMNTMWVVHLIDRAVEAGAEDIRIEVCITWMKTTTIGVIEVTIIRLIIRILHGTIRSAIDVRSRWEDRWNKHCRMWT
mmetsp:Transcript_4179/g.7216  ORF Transcript_4179/g.7216 Transcript_4179/m.7216 type:complete len:136 (+) Transcript_4179:2077-2484(+)